MRHFIPNTLLLFLSFLAFSLQPSFAAGYYFGEVGSRSLARGGANIVNPQSAAAVWLNPAALSQIEHVDLQLNNSLLYFGGTFTRDCGQDSSEVYCGPTNINRQYGAASFEHTANRPNINDDNFFSPNTPNGSSLGRKGTPSRFKDGHSISNQSPLLYIPSFFFALNLKDLGLHQVTVGGGIWAPHSGDYAFNTDEYSRYILINRDVFQIYSGLSLAYSFHKYLSIGVGVQLVTTGMEQEVKISADRYGNESPDSDIQVKVTAADYVTPTANIGLWSRPFKHIQLGGSLQLGQSIKATGDLEIQKYGEEIQELMKKDGDTPAILALNIQDPKVTIRFNLPAIYRLGIKYDRSFYDNLLAFDLEFDLVYEQWSAFDSVQVDVTGINFSFAGAPEQSAPKVVLAKDYQDSFSLRLGGGFYVLEKMLQLHGGIFYESAAIPNQTLSVDQMNGQKIGLGLGTSIKAFGATIDLAYSHLFIADRIIGQESIVYVENQTPKGLAGGDLSTRASMGKYQMSYDMISLALSYSF